MQLKRKEKGKNPFCSLFVFALCDTRVLSNTNTATIENGKLRHRVERNVKRSFYKI